MMSRWVSGLLLFARELVKPTSTSCEWLRVDSSHLWYQPGTPFMWVMWVISEYILLFSWKNILATGPIIMWLEVFCSCFKKKKQASQCFFIFVWRGSLDFLRDPTLWWISLMIFFCHPKGVVLHKDLPRTGISMIPVAAPWSCPQPKGGWVRWNIANLHQSRWICHDMLYIWLLHAQTWLNFYASLKLYALIW